MGQLFILSASPDVVVLEELDHYAQVAEALTQIGYTSMLGHATKYAPSHMDGHDDRNAEGAKLFCQALEKKGHAFLPHLSSASMQYALRRGGYNQNIVDAADTLGVKDKVVDAKTGKLSRSWTWFGRWFRAFAESCWNG